MKRLNNNNCKLNNRNFKNVLLNLMLVLTKKLMNGLWYLNMEIKEFLIDFIH